MAKNVLWATFFALLAAMLQSTLLSRLAIYHAVPDLVLGIIVFMSYNNGSMTGQLTGFCSGILMDFLSASPLGLNMLIRTVIGGVSGLMRGTFFLDVIFLPMFLCAAATGIKALLFFGLHILFTEGVPSYTIDTPMLWVEIISNTILAPFLFAFLKLFKSLLIRERNP